MGRPELVKAPLMHQTFPKRKEGGLSIPSSQELRRMGNTHPSFYFASRMKFTVVGRTTSIGTCIAGICGRYGQVISAS